MQEANRSNCPRQQSRCTFQGQLNKIPCRARDTGVWAALLLCQHSSTSSWPGHGQEEVQEWSQAHITKKAVSTFAHAFVVHPTLCAKVNITHSAIPDTWECCTVSKPAPMNMLHQPTALLLLLAANYCLVLAGTLSWPHPQEATTRASLSGAMWMPVATGL